MNAAQRKYLTGRLNAHTSRIVPPDRWRCSNGGLVMKPPEVLAAEKVIATWEKQHDKEFQKEMGKISLITRWVSGKVMLGTNEEALAAVELFETLRRGDDFTDGVDNLAALLGDRMALQSEDVPDVDFPRRRTTKKPTKRRNGS